MLTFGNLNDDALMQPQPTRRGENLIGKMEQKKKAYYDGHEPISMMTPVARARKSLDNPELLDTIRLMEFKERMQSKKKFIGLRPIYKSDNVGSPMVKPKARLEAKIPDDMKAFLPKFYEHLQQAEVVKHESDTENIDTKILKAPKKSGKRKNYVVDGSTTFRNLFSEFNAVADLDDTEDNETNEQDTPCLSEDSDASMMSENDGNKEEKANRWKDLVPKETLKSLQQLQVNPKRDQFLFHDARDDQAS